MPRAKDADGGEDGMMLTEVLVALAIVSLLSIAMFRVFATTADTVRRVEQSRRNLDIAEDILSRLTRQPDARAGRTSGSMEGIVWQVDLRPLTGTARGAHPRALVARIRVDNLAAPPLLTSVIVGAAP
ncbi:hypothetical protein SAMN05880582_104132 [Rhizobium sp. RU20A]|uniref:hypothetical protein n=1 Tax=Rhizobium sp. RU20A TaxID=1907412 RepID=UPI0009561F53|nr:hypothetical protein [Rhizobium sp. RU20A]SIQ86858.1 hypothetical protein SAMN05880582_104132 [Rhizobium sp. RU20A]